ncbi:MAG: hypothetical protein AAFX56_06090 [Pseudomonadota bacterium]
MNQRLFPRRLALPLLVTAALAAAPACAQLKPAMQDPAKVLERVAAPDVQQSKQQLDLLVRKSGTDWAAVEAVLARPGLDDAGKEFLLHDVLLRIRDVEPDDDALTFVARLRDYASKVYVPHEEGPLPVAAYPISTLAEGTLSLWQRRDVMQKTAIALAAGDMRGLEYLRQPGTDEYAGALAALNEADVLAIRQAREWLTANAGGSDFYRARCIAALKVGDSREISRLLQSGSGVAALQTLHAVRANFEADTAFGVLQTATDNPSIASAAVFEIDALRGSGLTAQVDDYLLDTLADPALGATAATIIARREDPGLLTRVADLLTASDATASQQARAVLALRLTGNQQARRALRDAIESKSLTDPALHKEVARWLQD